ncbi:MAG: diguanylate cyclase [Ruminococcus sp.]|nr:diguanylate cyclase [Ruminococcus sp.]
MKIKHTFIVMATAFLIVPILVLCLFASGRFENFHVSNRNLNTTKIINIAQKEIEGRFDEMSKNAYDFSANSHIINYLSGNEEEMVAVSDVITGVVDTDDDIVQAAIYDDDGKLLSVSSAYNEGVYPSITVETLESIITDNAGLTHLNEFQLLDSNKNTIAYVFRIHNASNFIGYGVFYYNLSMFEQVITRIESSTEMDLIISDNRGNIIMSPFNNILTFSQLTDYQNVVDQFKMIITDRKVVPTEYNNDNEEMVIMGGAITSTRNKKGATWGVLASMPTRIILEGSNQLATEMAVFSVIAMLVFIGAAVFLTLKYLKPLDDVASVFEKRANGDKFARFNGEGKSEVVQIGNGVNSLIDMINLNEERYNIMVDMTDNIIFEYSVAKDQVTFSDNFNSKFSFRAKTQKFADSFFLNGVVERKGKADFEEFVDKMVAGESLQGEFSFKNIYNDYAWYIVRCASIRDNNGNISKIIGAMIDIDRAKKREENLLKKANYDSLTQILNRQSFEVNLMNEFDLSQMRKTKVAVLFIDLDDFKNYNNNYSHALGDEALTFVGSTLKRVVGNNGFAGRYGGDEFVLCYSETPTSPSAGDIAKLIIREFGIGFDGVAFKEHFVVKCSIGIAYFTDHTMDADSVIKDADEAMYSVKKSGKSAFAYYSKPR